MEAACSLLAAYLSAGVFYVGRGLMQAQQGWPGGRPWFGLMVIAGCWLPIGLGNAHVRYHLNGAAAGIARLRAELATPTALLVAIITVDTAL